MSALDVGHFRDLLLEKREGVAGALENLQRENSRSLAEQTGELVSGSADQHLADTATETVEREIGNTLEDHDVRLLEAIDAALGRIEDGTYGKCVNCGGAIPTERLEAMPWATLCIDCKRKEER
ncbi:MAG TPA: TraR/DksA C4-type zinc finger protein [Gaiellaceae bacterium]|nr:TraR/DksA C4-type zinc finger protein [Gaiellaceae bacterium]